MNVPDIRIIQPRKKPCTGKTVRLHGDIGNGMPAAVQLPLEGSGPVLHGGRGADGRPRALQNNVPGQDEVLVPVRRSAIIAQCGQPLRAGNQVRELPAAVSAVKTGRPTDRRNGKSAHQEQSRTEKA